ncbi:MAG: hypothetical protein ACRDY0_00235 [Acidimicrobiales bacterium]
MPDELRAAQDAIRLPEIQEVLRKLGEHNLGIYMPHVHDERSGAFEVLPAGVTQVEDGLEVTFRQAADLLDGPDRSYLPVGWFWRDGAVAMACTSRCVLMGTMHTSGHDSGGDDAPEPAPDDAAV